MRAHCFYLFIYLFICMWIPIFPSTTYKETVPIGIFDTFGEDSLTICEFVSGLSILDTGLCVYF
jgi:hypothetical protein